MYHHAHLVNNHVIAHSHPYKHDPLNSSPFQSHSHSSFAYSAIGQLNQANWDGVPDIFQIPEPIFFLLNCSIDYIQPSVSFDNYPFAQLRAPPSIG